MACSLLPFNIHMHEQDELIVFISDMFLLLSSSDLIMSPNFFQLKGQDNSTLSYWIKDLLNDLSGSPICSKKPVTALKKYVVYRFQSWRQAKHTSFTTTEHKNQKSLSFYPQCMTHPVTGTDSGTL